MTPTSLDARPAVLPARSAVLSMALCAFVLVGSEFLPASLLTPIARDLMITEGLAGQTIAISAVVAMFTSLFVSGATRGLDRRLVVNIFCTLLITSTVTMVLAPNYLVLMLGRAVLGFAIGGFWSMSTAIVMRLVPDRAQQPAGLALLNAGNALAGTLSAPIGTLLASLLGWRGAFLFIVPIALLALVWQRLSLPQMPSHDDGRSRNVFRLLLRREVALGMAACTFLFMGQFGLFTYLRPYLEEITGLDVAAISALLLLMGGSGVVGTWVIGRLLRKWLFELVVGVSTFMATLAIAFIVLGHTAFAVALMMGAWGFLATAAPVAWHTWLSRILPDDAEAGGGLQVALFQVGITMGAALGGLLFDHVAWWGPFVFSAVMLCVSAGIGFWASRVTKFSH